MRVAAAAQFENCVAEWHSDDFLWRGADRPMDRLRAES
jgi:hypothetical protein